MRFSEFCQQLPIKVTDLRLAVLKILWQAKLPLKAYDVLDKLCKVRKGAKPTTVYRVLDFLVAEHVIHKIPSIQSYTLCCRPRQQSDTDVLMVCNACHMVTEVIDPVMHALVENLSQQHHFAVDNDSIEIQGLCARCCQ